MSSTLYLQLTLNNVKRHFTKHQIMAPLYNSSHRHRGPSTPTLLRAIAILLTVASFDHYSSCPSNKFLFVSAQNIASKVASRSKLVDKKKRKHVEEGKFPFWRRQLQSEEVVNDTSWILHDLFTADLYLMCMSIITSGLIALLTWVWYKTVNKNEAIEKQEDGNGGECMVLYCAVTPFPFS